MTKVPYSDLISYYVNRADRRALDLRTAGVPECIVLGHSFYRRAYPPLPEHRHFGVAELAYVEAGHQPYDVGGRYFKLFGGEGTVIPPDTLHSSGGQPSYPGNRFWLQFRLPQEGDRRWLGLSIAEAAPLVDMLRSPVNTCAKWPADFAKRINELFDLFDRPPSLVRTAMLRTSLLSILFALLDLNSTTPPLAYQARVKKAADWAEAHFSDRVTLEHLADAAGLSVSSFKQVFKDIVGITPHAYLLRKRIEHAQALLSKGESSITDIALACGFLSSQYFATAFKRIVGVTPNDMLKKRAVPLPSDADGQ
jgi:AraC-like DNA-binding protein